MKRRPYLYGTPPEAAVVVLQSLGVDAVGVNCSTGPEDMAAMIRTMYDYADIPLLAKPNAGLPELEDGRTVYRMTPEEFGRDGKLLVEAGARIVGGCCGTTPEHIKALSGAVRDMPPRPIGRTPPRTASERQVTEISLSGPFRSLVNASIRRGRRPCRRNCAKGSCR